MIIIATGLPLLATMVFNNKRHNIPELFFTHIIYYAKHLTPCSQ